MDADLTPERIRWIVQGMVMLLLSIAVHEFGHAWVADRLGDRLPRRQGRVTLNPIAHADPVGTVLLPLAFLALTGGLGFGWGKPVYHNTHDRKKRVFIAAAGPAMNVLLGTLIATVHMGLIAGGVLSVGDTWWDILRYAVILNFVLFFFNMLPFAPLDGGSVARGLIPENWVESWDKIAVYGIFIVGAFIMIRELAKVFLVPAGWVVVHLYQGLGTLFGF
jgi:Zn-dependent protease